MKFARFCFIFFIYTCQALIGTPPMLVELQMLAIAGAGAGVMIIAWRQRTLIFPPAFIVFFMLFLAYLSFSTILALELGQTPISVMVRFIQVFLTTFAAPLLVYSFWKLGIMTRQNLLKHILLATITYMVLKFLIVVFFLFSGVSVLLLDLVLVGIFKTTATTGGAAGSIIRFMAPADFLAPFLLYYAIVFMTGWRRLLTAAIMAMGIYISFSRFIWVESAFALAMCIFSFPRKQLFSGMLVLLVAGPFALPFILPTIEHRFFDPGSSRADAIRSQQSVALLQDSERYFLFGHGMASYSYKMVRDRRSPYTYEEQWLALFYQLGFVGVVFLLGLLTFNLGPFLVSRRLEALPMLLLFIFSLSSGFANPSLTGRSAGAGFAFVLCVGLLVQQRGPSIRRSPGLSGGVSAG